MWSRLAVGWNWLPVIVRAIVLGWLVLTIGSIIPFLPLFGNLKFHPDIPWAFPITLLILALYWAYFSGWGPPATTRDARRKFARFSWPAPRIWGAAIPAIFFGVIGIVAMRLLLPSVLPVAAPSVAIALSSYPQATVIGALLSIAAIAAVTEEIAFRGYMQQPLEERYGIVPAVLVVGVMFWVAHLDHGITITHLPFHIAASVALGLLAYLTRSLVPAMIPHFVGDIFLQPAYLFRYPEFVWNALSARPVWDGVASAFPEKLRIVGSALSPQHMFVVGDPFRAIAIIAWIFLMSAMLTIIAFLNLMRVTRRSHTELSSLAQARGPSHC
jgi:membrane protease YdiL (CAAX protease family)